MQASLGTVGGIVLGVVLVVALGRLIDSRSPSDRPSALAWSALALGAMAALAIVSSFAGGRFALPVVFGIPLGFASIVSAVGAFLKRDRHWPTWAALVVGGAGGVLGRVLHRGDRGPGLTLDLRREREARGYTPTEEVAMDTVVLHSLADTVEIAPGVHMPRLGVGTFRADPGADVENEVTWALELGYRGIDTASMYGNEEGVGRAIAASGISRQELFVATKLWNDEQGYDETLAACERSLTRLGLDYVDLYLIHWPRSHTTQATWKAMQKLRSDRRVRAIGVCNFLVPHLEDLLSFAEIPPAVDQVEHHPRLQQPDLREFCATHGVTMQAWAPIMRGRVAEIPEIAAIAATHAKTAAQVTIRWVLQHGVTTIPKSVHRERVAENADVYDFELTDAEMAVIDSLDRGERLGRHPDSFAELLRFL